MGWTLFGSCLPTCGFAFSASHFVFDDFMKALIGLRMGTRPRKSIGDDVAIFLRGREIFVEKSKEDDSVMVRKAARRDVVFSKVLGMKLTRSTLV